MAKLTTGAVIPVLDGAFADGPRTLYKQLYDRVREAILTGALPLGGRLPSTRTLAADLGVSRNTVEGAFAQLQAEGFLVRRVGAGTFVAGTLPEGDRPPRATRGQRSRPAAPARPEGADALSARGRAVAAAAPGREPFGAQPLVPCLPALDLFPFQSWQRVVARRVRRSGRELLHYGEAEGYRPLREAVATHVATARAVRCDWRQVVILTSTQQALDLVGRLLLDPSDAAWIEDPGYGGARAALATAGARLVPVPVDGEGLVVDAGVARAPHARLAYVTPSHQFPLGGAMSLARRLALLQWARRQGSWIVEDDYDSELRYTGRPLASLQGLDAADRVVYVGTFNKVMFPSLRLAYAVVPPDLVDAVAAARQLVDGHTPTLMQAALADFIEAGHFGAHLRQMRVVYRERRDAFLAAVAAELGPRLELGASDTGMHVTGWLGAAADDRLVVARAARRGVELRALSGYYLGPGVRQGLVLGYSCAPPPVTRRALRTLSSVLSAIGEGDNGTIE
jgi:GntR family transcriptional regulator/MocR family aminotransferase